ncbi:MAG: hypothetical protein H6534_00755 [Chthonomonadaceae bacterium]|nr:hypothetical protein [Chthonomonadaceae bacterium]
MLTEFEVRRRVSEIQISDIAPTRKARLILRLGRKLKAQTRLHARALSARSVDRNTAVRFERMLRSFQKLYEEVRQVAEALLLARAGTVFAPA